MNNKLLSLLVLIGIAGAGYLYYTLKYLPYIKALNQEEIQRQEEELQIQKEPKLVKQVIQEIKLTNTQKIDELKDSNKNYKTIKLDNLSKAYFTENGNSLDLFYEDKNIGNFNLVYPQFLRVEIIKGTGDDLYIEVGNDKFYYNNNTNILKKIDLNIEVKYVKGGSINKLIIVTDKGSFVYSIFNETLEYFTYFNDFVFYNDGYIGLVNKAETRILNNLGFENNDNNIVVYYNPNTKEKKIVYKTDLNLNKIFIYNGSVFVNTDDGEIYEMENVK